MNKKLKFITTSAVIAALYAVLTIVFAPISFGFNMVEFRISEVLTILPFFTPAAIPGLFVGCIISNILSPLGPVDVLVGSLASLLAAYLTWKMPKKFLAPLPPIICNGLLVGIELHYILNYPLIASMLSVAFGEAVVCFLGGYPLLLVLNKYKKSIFR